MAVPPDTPVTTPVEELTATIDVLFEDHVPPAVPPVVNVLLAPAQIDVLPVIVPATGMTPIKVSLTPGV